MSEIISITASGQNWCKKLNHEIDDFTVKVLCFTPCSKGCANCPEYTYKRTKVFMLDCSKMKDAYACLKAKCDYAEACEGQFICHKPKDMIVRGRSTRITFEV